MNNRIVDELKNELTKLSKEFDCLGLPSINVNVDIVDQLITNVFRLVQLYRKSLNKVQDVNIENSRLQEECRTKKNKIESLKDNIDDGENELKKQSNQMLIYQSEINALQLKLQEKEADLHCAKAYSKRKETELGHKITRLQLDIGKLKGATKLAKYVSQDETIVDTLYKHKVKQEIYEDTIRKLQSNNDELIGEILNLKEEILLALSQQGKCDCSKHKT